MLEHLLDSGNIKETIKNEYDLVLSFNQCPS